MRISAHIYGIYRKFVSEEDIFPYSIDEVFIIISEQKIWFDDIMRIEDYFPEGRETWL